MGEEKKGDGDPNIHADEKQETGKTGKSHYRKDDAGCKE